MGLRFDAVCLGGCFGYLAGFASLLDCCFVISCCKIVLLLISCCVAICIVTVECLLAAGLVIV